MKKALLLAMSIAITLSAGAQKKMMKAARNAYEDKEFEKAYGLIQTAKDNDESKILADTWMVRGNILQALAKDSLLSIKYPDALIESYDSYIKALEIDKRKKDDLIELAYEFNSLATKKGLDMFNLNKFERAYSYFNLNLKMRGTCSLNATGVDTAGIYFTGRAALSANFLDTAIVYLKKAVDYKFLGADPYRYLKEAYILKGDTAKSLETLQRAFEAYSSDMSVIVDLINFYLQAGKQKEALAYLGLAKEKDPTNSQYWFVEGSLYEKLNDLANAEIAYQKAAELDPNGTGALFNLGVMYYNSGVNINNDATKENDNKKYAELIKKRNVEFNKAIPFFERAHVITPKDESIAKSLNSLYMYLQLTDKVKVLKEEMGW